MTQPATVETRAPTATNQKSAGDPNMQRGARQQATINTQIHLLKYYQPFQLSPLQWQGRTMSVSVGGEIDNKKASFFMRIAASLVLGRRIFKFKLMWVAR